VTIKDTLIWKELRKHALIEGSLEKRLSISMWLGFKGSKKTHKLELKL